VTDIGMLRLKVGQDVWLDGQLWEISALEGKVVILAGGKEVRRVSQSYLVARKAPVTERSSTFSHPASLEVTMLGKEDKDKLSVLTAALIEIRNRKESGEKAHDLFAEKAEELGCSWRTLYRNAYFESGTDGLIHRNVTRRRSDGIDPRWVETARAVIADPQFLPARYQKMAARARVNNRH
jgi:hypothetical protein